MARWIVAVAGVALVFSSLSCRDEGEARRAPPARFEAVRAEEATTGAGFCEKAFPAGAKRYVVPPLRSLPAGARAAPAAEEGGWTWVNVWATWCTPCIEEMALLARWQDALAREGHPFRLELLSADDPADGEALAKAIDRGLPGSVSWLRGPDDLGPYLDALGVSRNAALPIHALVDPRGQLRCVRVGAIHDRDYGVVKRLLVAP
jgi:thiol-disulfide isomerase/thioredoxin